MFEAILFGIIEGLTEFVPVSSTAHLLLTGKLVGIASGPFLEALSIGIQSGAILAAVLYFWKLVWANRPLIGKVLIAFIPTAIAGMTLYPLIKSLFASTFIVAIALIVGGIGLLLITPVDEETPVSTISYKQAFLIGLAQIASFIPGISRAGATLIGGSLLRIPRSVIVPFSFLLAIPTIIGASVVEIVSVKTLSSQEGTLILVGAIVAFLVALGTIRFFITLLTKKPLWWFGWYRIVIGVFVLIFLV